jgi:hypothetical protein
MACAEYIAAHAISAQLAISAISRLRASGKRC